MRSVRPLRFESQGRNQAYILCNYCSKGWRGAISFRRLNEINSRQLFRGYTKLSPRETIAPAEVLESKRIELLIASSNLGFLLVARGCLRRLFGFCGVPHVVRRRLDLARHETVNPFGP